VREAQKPEEPRKPEGNELDPQIRLMSSILILREMFLTDPERCMLFEASIYPVCHNSNFPQFIQPARAGGPSGSSQLIDVRPDTCMHDVLCMENKIF
jgi:hypothetical protein